MGKTYLSTVKYLIKTKFSIEGIVDKHDIIGAVFGQSEGLMGEDMDLKELQQSGKLGRIDVEATTHNGKTSGTMTIPSGVDKVKTSLLAAAIETVDKVGPCDSKFETIAIEDTRGEKRKTVTERAKELLQKMGETMPESSELAAGIVNDLRGGEIQQYGEDKLPAGPDIDKNEELIIVEGRADVLNLLKYGIKNCIALNGAATPKTIIDLSRKKTTTLFMDGDRGGYLVARQLAQVAKIDFTARAPSGKEVEELTQKEILAALRKKRPLTERSAMSRMPEGIEPTSDYGERKKTFDERSPSRGFRSERSEGSGFKEGNSGRGFRSGAGTGFRSERSEGSGFREGNRGSAFGEGPGGNRGSGRSFGGSGAGERGRGFGGRGRSERFSAPMEAYNIEQRPNDLGEFGQQMQELNNTLRARFLDEKMQAIKEISVRDLLQEMRNSSNVHAIVFDGIITKRLAEQAAQSGIHVLVGVKKGKIEETGQVKILSMY
ncbi:MAG: DNA primase DnaG [Candidatus Diapherotrites archaeon]|nr:DNA primase DnaG [Candidatus Diapherotrites archaeon]